MRRRRRFRVRNGARSVLAGWLLVVGSFAWLAASSQDQEQPSGGVAVLLSIQDAIGPATSDYLVRGIETAATRSAALVVIEMDTPGGLDSAMRDIIQAILSSPVPVVTFVHPQGARAASAGTYILYASHVAAMAPATNLGAATPVAIGGAPPPAPAPGDADEDGRDDPSGGDQGDTPETRREPSPPEPATASERKAINDAVAYIRSLAERRGRNADWAEAAVRSAESLSAQAALERNVIDLIAVDLDDLLQKLDGRRVMLDGETIELDTDTLVYERIEPDWRTKLLAVISNPTVAYMLLLLGIYGLIFEGYNPGAIVPGVVGAISLLLALFSLQVLPVNYAGLALIALGVILMVAEFLVPSFGALGIGGIAAFVFGSVILYDSDVPGYDIATPLIATISAAAALSLLVIIWLAMKARVRPVVSGVEDMLRETATALEDFEREGPVRVYGERWNARSTRPVRKGDRLRVTKVEGLLLHVEPIDDVVVQRSENVPRA
ncbi:MAG TPA: nodulation protein NfeD [Gammaproteobacteria bacterium]